MKLFLAMSLLLLNLACNNSSGDKKSDDKNGTPNGTPNGGLNGGQNGDNTEKPLNNITAYSECDRGTPTYDIRGAWRQVLKSEDFEMNLVLEITNQDLRLTNMCRTQGRDLTVSVASPIRFDANTVSIMASAQDSQEIQENDFNFTCNVNLQPQSFTYGFDRSCLVLRDMKTQEEQKFIPAR